MTRTPMNAALLGVLTTGLAACAATPTYPTGQASSAVPASVRTIAPGPVSATPQPPPPPVPQAPPPSPAPMPAAVQTTTLAPLASPTTTPPTSATLPPAPQAASPPPMTMAPPVSEAPPPEAYHPPSARYIATGKVIVPRNMYRQYEVQKHDHLDAIARGLQVSPQALIKANHLKDADHLTPGQRLRIPVDKAYEARSGDTLAAVAKRFSLSLADLAAVNDLSEHARLTSGEQLALPDDYHDRGPVEIEASRSERLSPYRQSYAAPATGRPYVPSAYALAAGRAARARAAAEAAGGSGTSPGTYAPAPSSLTAQSAPPAAALSDSQVIALAHGRFIWPVQGAVISAFGAKGPGVRNDGVDIASPLGAVVHAAAPGDVVYAGDQIPGFGNLVLLQHSDGWVTAYAHLQRTSVQMRQFVTQGQEIGEVGQTGGVTQPQLHFEVRYKASAGEKAKPVDPQLVLPALAAGAGASQR